MKCTTCASTYASLAELLCFSKDSFQHSLFRMHSVRPEIALDSRDEQVETGEENVVIQFLFHLPARPSALETPGMILDPEQQFVRIKHTDSDRTPRRQGKFGVPKVRLTTRNGCYYLLPCCSQYLAGGSLASICNGRRQGDWNGKQGNNGCCKVLEVMGGNGANT